MGRLSEKFQVLCKNPDEVTRFDGMFLGLADPLVRGTDPDPDPFIIKQKTVRKALIPTVLWRPYDFLSLQIDVNVPTKSNKQKNFKKIIIFGGVLKVTDKDSRIRSRIS